MTRNDVLEWIISVLNTESDYIRQRRKAIEEELRKGIPYSVPIFGLG